MFVIEQKYTHINREDKTINFSFKILKNKSVILQLKNGALVLIDLFHAHTHITHSF